MRSPTEKTLGATSARDTLGLAKMSIAKRRSRMRRRPIRPRSLLFIPLALVLGCAPGQDDALEIAPLSSALSVSNESGTSQTFTATGTVDMTNEFFQNLGTNGRACVTCHQPGDNWTIVPTHLQQRFDATSGTDPVFRTNDGSNSPLADVSTVAARRKAYSMLLSKGLIRIGISIPAGAEFELASVDDPYGYASAAHGLSLFRRPLPTTNLKFLSTVMWDGRETFRDAASSSCLKPPLDTSVCFAPLTVDLSDQANGAPLGHAQGTLPLTTAQRDSIVAFELGLFTAQTFDNDAKALNAAHAEGGPSSLSTKPFYF